MKTGGRWDGQKQAEGTEGTVGVLDARRVTREAKRTWGQTPSCSGDLCFLPAAAAAADNPHQ